MLAFLAIFSAALAGYAHLAVVSWPIAALSLALLSWAQYFIVIRRGFDEGLGEAITDTLTRSFINALVVTGACYWAGVALRSFSI
jgi:hypothetical protein